MIGGCALNYYEKLLEQKNKTFTVEKLRALTMITDYNKFVEVVTNLVKEIKLAPVKASGTNGKKINTLYNKYKLIKQPNDYMEILEEIKLLSVEFNHQAYFNKPDEYIKYREEIRALDEFLRRDKADLKVTASINERSFQIWGKEKLLKEKNIIQRIFLFNGLDLDMLNFYETPEPFFEYIYSYESDMNILIIENKDTWYTMRKLIREKNINKCGNKYNVLLYGEGKKIIRNNEMLDYYDKEILKVSNNKYFYFGDLDYEGISIFNSLKQLYPTLNIVLDVEFYILMLDICDIYKLPSTKEGQQRVEIKSFLKLFSNEYQNKIRYILTSGRYIPQEIVNYKKIVEIMG